MLRNRTYMGAAEWFRHETIAPPAPGRTHGRQTLRPKEAWIRVDELDAFVFAQMRDILLRPDALLTGEQALVAREPAPDDEILAAQLARIVRRVKQAAVERRRITDLYQAGHIDMPERGRRVTGGHGCNGAPRPRGRVCRAGGETRGAARDHVRETSGHPTGALNLFRAVKKGPRV